MDGPVFVSLNPGSTVRSAGRDYVIKRNLTLDVLLVEDAETGETKRIRVIEVETSRVPEAGEQQVGALESIPDETWAIAQRRFKVIEPLVNRMDRRRGEVEEAAAAADATAATVYDWIKRFERSGHVTSLIPRAPGRRQGAKQLSAELEEVIAQSIETVLLTEQKLAPTDVIEAVGEYCERNGLTAPGENTIRRRIDEVDEERKLRKRGMRDEARKLKAAPGKFPATNHPMQVIQIDHTPADLVVLTADRLRELGRPWMTLAIDVHTRMIVGYCLDMERPSAETVGECISMAVLPKDALLAGAGIKGSWPVWGKPGKVHWDNAGEFDSKAIERACDQHGIGVEFRAVDKPNWGGHIERLCGTVNRRTHKLPGTTFSNPVERGKYDSNKKAVLTLDEFEHWLLEYIVNVYNASLHKGIGMPPIAKWTEAILGNAKVPGRGLPALFPDPDRLRLDFLPYEMLTVQHYGLQWDHQRYHVPALDRWIGSEDEGTGATRKFLVRRSRRRMSPVWFEDPELRQYIEVPFADATMPILSLWEHRDALKQHLAEGKAKVNHNNIKEAYKRNLELVENAAAKTKAARRAEHRRRMTEREVAQAPSQAVRSRMPPPSPQPPVPAVDDPDADGNALPVIIDINVYE